MKRLFARRPSPALIISLIALFVALGGTGYAALNLPKNSVGTKQLKNNAVTGSKVKNGSLRSADFKPGQIPAGPAGPAGPQGPKGDPGSALAFAHVAANGTLDAANSKGIAAASHFATGTGQYCLTVGSAFKNAVATVDASTGGTSDIATVDTGRVGLATGLGLCPAGTNILVFTRNDAGTAVDVPFYVNFN